jgi:ribosomal protein L14E/L6E/L27E
MKKQLKSGDLVKSTLGRDKDNVFIVVSVNERIAFIADGKIHKIQRTKKKNVKHLEKVSTASLIEYADRIQTGKALSNQRVYRAIKSQQK